MNDEEIEKKILEFIRQNPESTVNQVADFLTLQRILSYVPARNKVISLIEQGIIDDRKQGNSFHRLFINDKNEFNIIDKQLTEIEYVLNDLREVNSISESAETDDALTSPVIQAGFKNLDFTNACGQYLLLMLRILLVETAHRIKSQKHSQIVYNRIVKLMINMDNQLINNPRYSRRIYKFAIDRDLHLIEERFRSYPKKTGIYDTPINNLRRMTENFKHNILD
jgi:hypothetical protein